MFPLCFRFCELVNQTRWEQGDAEGKGLSILPQREEGFMIYDL